MAITTDGPAVASDAKLAYGTIEEGRRLLTELADRLDRADYLPALSSAHALVPIAEMLVAYAGREVLCEGDPEVVCERGDLDSSRGMYL